MYLSDIIQQLLETPYAKKVDNDHITVRCPICGDSRKHHDSSHCVIWYKEDQPLIYHCWICENSGLVDNSFLTSLDIRDTEVINSVHTHNKANSKRTMSQKIKENGEVKVPIHIPKIHPKHGYKIEYIQQRLGIPFTLQSMEYLRVITSIKDFLELNQLDPNPKYHKMLSLLEKDYVGFLSNSKGFIIFRSINPKNKLRYINYNIFDSIISPGKFYTIPASVDMMSEDITLHISEGIFDILSIFFNIHQANTSNQIYTAVCGSGYKTVVEYFIKKGFIGNLHIHIYSDLDKNKYFYKPIIDMRKWFKSVDIYYNRVEGEKDFGVPKDRISPVKINL